MLDRFEEKFIVDSVSKCWLWQASCHGRGYGFFYTGRSTGGAKMEYAHRISYELYKGEMPGELEVCHTCDTPSCVNPDHLFLGDHSDNMQDMVSKRRHRPGTERLTEADVIAILTYPDNQKTTAAKFGIDAGYCSRLRNFKVAKWAHLKEVT